MRFLKITIILLALTLHSALSYGQKDTNITAIPTITDIPLRFLKNTNDKIDKYSNRLNSKTEKTLTKLSNWEAKLEKRLQKISPQIAQQLFGEGKQTFASMLAKVKEGKSLVEENRKRYDQYRDQLSTNIKYLETQKEQLDNKYLQPLTKAKQKINDLDNTVAETETAERLIKERKKQLLTEAYKVLGKSKYLKKINEETFYFSETLQNYKQIFSEPGAAEKKALELLGRIPAVKEFVQQNSMLASLFGSPSSGGSTASLAGLQTRASVNSLISNRIASGGSNAAAQISANMQAAQAELSKLKDKIIKAGGGGSSSDADIPDFKINPNRSKTFKQRLVLGSDFQFGRPNRFTSSQANLGISLGYKLGEKSMVGAGISMKIDYGSISDFYVKTGGLGLRSFFDYKMKKQFFISAGYEMNFNQSFKNYSDLRNADGTRGIGNLWQSSGLIGISKKINMKAKWVKGTKIQLLYDMLYKTHAVSTQPVVFRVGYNF
jgi:hypothetical protein